MGFLSRVGSAVDLSHRLCSCQGMAHLTRRTGEYPCGEWIWLVVCQVSWVSGLAVGTRTTLKRVNGLLHR